MKNLKKWIIILTILVIVIIAILIFILFFTKSSAKILYGVDEEGSDISYDVDTTLKEVTNRNNYYIVKNAVNKFYTYYYSMNTLEGDVYIMDEDAEESIKEIQLEYAQVIYDMLDNDYKEYAGITTSSDIISKLNPINEVAININKMYVSQRTVDTSIYIVEGTVREKITSNISNFKMMIEVDALNRVFSIFLQDYIDEKYPTISIGEEFNASENVNIEKNSNNVYDYQNITDETYCVDLISKYKEEILYNTELAYEHLDNEYKTKKFTNLEEFQNYAKNNVRKNVLLELNQYQKITSNDGYTLYVCLDQNGKYYIFKENAVMDYGIILDTYTIDLPEFVEQYNSSTDEKKVQFNIQKFFDAINDGDYAYTYNKLDQTYRNNNFPTQVDFENYMKTTFYAYNKLGYTSYEKNGDLYIYKMVITNREESTQTIEKQFVVKLLEGTDFVMSFEK